MQNDIEAFSLNGEKRLQELDFEEYISGAAAPKFLSRIDHVASFSYEAETNFLGGWPDDSMKIRRVIFRLQRTLQDALRLSSFHNLSQLQARRFSDGIEFAYGDPDFDFTYSLDGRGRISLSRRASSARRFHEWYRRFMPSLPSIVMESIDAIDEELTGFDKDEADRDRNPHKKRPSVINVERASYNFRVAVQTSMEGFVDDVAIPNIGVLNQSLLRRVPANDGSLIDPLSISPDNFGRATYTVNRWQDPDKILEMYQVSGPSNNNWTMLFFDFSYLGDTFVPSQGDRKPFSQNMFVTGAQTSEAYLGFFRQRCVCRFMAGVLEGAPPFTTPPSW